jgi:hypothetical protein
MAVNSTLALVACTLLVVVGSTLFALACANGLVAIGLGATLSSAGAVFVRFAVRAIERQVK